MTVTIVSLKDRPDLVPLTVRWRWEAFMRDSGRTMDDVLAATRQNLAAGGVLPQGYVLLADGAPMGTASLTAHDLAERPDLTPWLAGVVVVPEARGRGYATRLVGVVEQAARTAGYATLWLYTGAAEGLYARIGWRTVETLQRNGRPYAVMRRALGAG